jgi:hypothetical protein
MNEVTYVIKTGTLYISYALLQTSSDPSFSFTTHFAQAQQYEKNDALAIFAVFGGHLIQVQSTLTDVTDNPPKPDPVDPIEPEAGNLADLDNAVVLNDSGTMVNNGHTLNFTKNAGVGNGAFTIPIKVVDRGSTPIEVDATYTVSNGATLTALTIQAQKTDGTTVDDILFNGTNNASDSPINFALTDSFITTNALGDSFNLLVTVTGTDAIQLSLASLIAKLQA